MLDETPGGAADEVADWLEAMLLCSERPALATDAILRYSKTELSVQENAVALALQRMSTREARLTSRYPFEITDLGIRIRSSDRTTAYAALLMLTSAAPYRRLLYPTPPPELDRLLDSVIVSACGRFWGDLGEAVRFAWPSSDGRPASFPAAIAWLAKRIGIVAAESYRPPLRKDGGVDVVSWMRFRDNRRGVPLLLVQSTVQADLIGKASDIETRVWANWLHMDVDPMTALAVPQQVSDPNLWNQVSVRTLLLDRMRLVELSDGEAGGAVNDWLQDAFSELKSEMVSGRL